MKTPEEILNEVAGENMINTQQMVTTKQLAIIAMRRYAIEYHDNKIKNLNLSDVSKSVDSAEATVCPKCGTKDIIVTIYCNQCHEAM